MSKLYRKASWYKPLHVDINDKRHEICSFIFYNEEGVIFKHDRGYLDATIEPNFDFDIVKKLKENFTKKISYIIKSKTDYDGRYDLYIHADLVGLKEPVYSIKYKSRVVATYETNIKDFAFEQYVKSLDESLNLVKKGIQEVGKKLDSYLTTSNSLQDAIDKLQQLKVLLKEEEDKLNSYTIEDYLKHGGILHEIE